MTLQKQILLFTEDKLISSPEAFLVNPTQQPEKDSAKKIYAIYGPRCLEQYEKLPQSTSWGKMFLACLIGMEGWYSTRCILTWSLRATKCRPWLYLRRRSMPLTAVTEFGSLPILPTPTAMGTDRNTNFSQGGTCLKNGLINMGMLPTPNSTPREVTTEQTMKRKEMYGGETRGMYLEHYAAMGLLPTPNSMDYVTATKPDTYEARKQRHAEKGVKLQMPLKQMAMNQMLPTPTLQDLTNSTFPPSQINRGHIVGHLMREGISAGSQLNPRFVAEMMGFPPNWTELPFLNGETNP